MHPNIPIYCLKIYQEGQNLKNNLTTHNHSGAFKHISLNKRDPCAKVCNDTDLKNTDLSIRYTETIIPSNDRLYIVFNHT